MTKFYSQDVDLFPVVWKDGIPFGSGDQQGAYIEVEVLDLFHEGQKEVKPHQVQNMPVLTAHRTVQPVSFAVSGKGCIDDG